MGGKNPEIANDPKGEVQDVNWQGCVESINSYGFSMAGWSLSR